VKRTIWAWFVAVASGLATVPAGAHDLVSLNGQAMDHQHVEVAGRYGTMPRQGHYAKPPGSASGILIFSARQPNSFGNLIPLEDANGLPGQAGTLHRQFETDMARHRVGDGGPQ